MRGSWAIGLVIAFAVTGAMFAGSGFNAAVAGDSDTSGVQEAISDKSGEGPVSNNGGLGGDPRASNDGTIIGFIIQAVDYGLTLALTVLVLPNLLVNLGFPSWFASPVGWVVQIATSVSLLQFAIGRILR